LCKENKNRPPKWRTWGAKKEEKIKHKKQIKTERWYLLVAGRKRIEKMKRQ